MSPEAENTTAPPWHIGGITNDRDVNGDIGGVVHAELNSKTPSVQSTATCSKCLLLCSSCCEVQAGVSLSRCLKYQKVSGIGADSGKVRLWCKLTGLYSPRRSSAIQADETRMSIGGLSGRGLSNHMFTSTIPYFMISQSKQVFIACLKDHALALTSSTLVTSVKKHTQ